MSVIRWFRKTINSASSSSLDTLGGDKNDKLPAVEAASLSPENSSEAGREGFEKVSFATAESISDGYPETNLHRTCMNCGAGIYHIGGNIVETAEEKEEDLIICQDDGLLLSSARDGGYNICTCGEENCKSRCKLSFPGPSDLRFSPYPLVLEGIEDDDEDDMFDCYDCFCSLECKWSLRFTDEVKLRQMAKLQKRQAALKKNTMAGEVSEKCMRNEAPTTGAVKDIVSGNVPAPGFTPGKVPAARTVYEPAVSSSRRLASLNPS